LADDHTEGVQIVDDEFDAAFGNGDDFMDVDLPEDSAVPPNDQHHLKAFTAALDDLHIQQCPLCREEAFSSQPAGEMCTSCSADKKETRKWSDANEVNPTNDVPPCLKGLTDMEEMLIARTKTVMQVRWTKGRQLCYKDHIVNLPQNIEEVAEKLPRLPEEVDMVIIHCDDVDMS
ncbi:hypothetical protein C8J56DRAFT_797036, partial [Mycena floridula]